MSNTKEVPVYVQDTLLDNTVITIQYRNNMWMANILDTGKLMKMIQTTMNPDICTSKVYEDRVVFSSN
jgi:hypothetical protein